MGSNQSIPEFSTHLADQRVRVREDVTLQCEAAIETVNVTWKKNGHELERVQGKHEVIRSGRVFSLVIRNVRQDDEGKYTIDLWNKMTRVSCSALVIVELDEWRIVQWREEPQITTLRNFTITKEGITELRFLLHGPVGSGKSSIINTIKSIFERHQFINCLAASDLSGTSFTNKYQKFTVGSDQSGNLPFAFYDVMGLEEDQSEGVRTDDIIKALKGHLPDNYKFAIHYSINEDNKHYITEPTLNNKIHCLVSVVAADKITLMDYKVIEKMKTIRAEASKLGIPQVVFMTRVDKVCVMTQERLTNLYKSKKIKEKMQECSNRLGVTMNCIFPVKNYHEETRRDENLNCLMLEAFSQIVHSAHDYVKKCPEQQKIDDGQTMEN